MPEVLPPPEQLPEEFQDKVPLDQLRGAANWAQRFQPSDVSFAQRFRHNRDIREYGEALQAKKEAELEANAKATAAAQNFFFKTRALEQKAKLDESLIASRHAKMEADLEMLPLRQQQIDQSTRTSAALERKRLSDELLKGAIDEHVGDFHTRLNQDALTGDGSPEAEDLAILGASRQYPKAYLHPEVKATVDEASKRIAARTRTANAVALTEQKALDRVEYSKLTAEQKLAYWEQVNAAKEEAATLADQRKVAAAALGNTQRVEAATVGDQRKVAAAGLTATNRQEAATIADQRRSAAAGEANANRVSAAGLSGKQRALEKQMGMVQSHIKSLQASGADATEIADANQIALDLRTELDALVGGVKRTEAPSAPTVWKKDKAGNRFEYDPVTKQPTGKYIKGG